MLPLAVVGNVDPQMSPERFSCQCARELDEKSSLPLQMDSGAEIWRDFEELLRANSLIPGKIQGISSVLTPEGTRLTRGSQGVSGGIPYSAKQGT
jgi:hypothetical protein